MYSSPQDCRHLNFTNNLRDAVGKHSANAMDLDGLYSMGSPARASLTPLKRNRSPTKLGVHMQLDLGRPPVDEAAVDNVRTQKRYLTEVRLPRMSFLPKLACQRRYAD